MAKTRDFMDNEYMKALLDSLDPKSANFNDRQGTLLKEFGKMKPPGSSKDFPFSDPKIRVFPVTVSVTLGQLYSGHTKKMKVGQKIFSIEIKKGYKSGTKITFAGENLDGVLYDIVFTVEQIADPTFSVEKSNLICKLNKNNFVTEKKYKISLSHPDGTTMQYVIGTESFKNGDIIVSNRGMWSNKNQKYGDMVIQFL
jgi:hypothetical protein